MEIKFEEQEEQKDFDHLLENRKDVVENTRVATGDNREIVIEEEVEKTNSRPSERVSMR